MLGNIFNIIVYYNYSIVIYKLMDPNTNLFNGPHYFFEWKIKHTVWIVQCVLIFLCMESWFMISKITVHTILYFKYTFFFDFPFALKVSTLCSFGSADKSVPIPIIYKYLQYQLLYYTWRVNITLCTYLYFLYNITMNYYI